MTPHEWARGDRVIHATKPEWGAGEVLLAQPSSHEGRPCQKLSVRFDRAGTKSLLTAFAELKPAGSIAGGGGFSPMLSSRPQQGSYETESDMNDPFSNAAAVLESMVERLTDLPERATDPFLPLRTRLINTLDIYRFTGTGGSLLDWAAAQTGLKDPLSRFNRHELEQHFQEFRVAADNHLRKLVREMARADAAGLRAMTAAASPDAQHALRRIDTRR